jgi:hypothetical protein
VSGGPNEFDYGSSTVPSGVLFVAADEPLLVFPSVRAAECWIEAIDVEDGVYPAAYGLNGEPFRVESARKRVIIEATGEPNRPEDLRALLLAYLHSRGLTVHDEPPTSELVEQVWRCESDFWQENDPYGDRFSKPFPGWCCFALILVPATVLFALVTPFRAPLIGIAVATLILWPIGILAKRRADRSDFRAR